MDRDIIRAFLWQEVTFLGFRPSGDKGRKKWLREYNRSLLDFWELGDYPDTPRVDGGALTGEIDAGFNLNLFFDYSVYEPEKFAVRFLRASNRASEFMWTHEVDGNYFDFPSRSVLNRLDERRKRNSALRKEAEKHDVAAVIDGLLCHPRTHQHIEYPITPHKIRIGGGIGNAFLFLFHLRYQLCLIKEKRLAERGRLIELFWDAIKNKSDHYRNELSVFELFKKV